MELQSSSKKNSLIFCLILSCSLVSFSIISCSIVSSFCDTETVTFTTDGFPEEQITLTVRKNVCTPVIKEIVVSQNSVQNLLQDTSQSSTQDVTVLYGTIYPYGTILTQKDSFAADVLRTMYAATDDSASDSQIQNFFMRFNWQRFMEECRNYENPWLLDKEKIMKAIASGSFKVTDLRLK